jgi:hypothetical protein
MSKEKQIEEMAQAMCGNGTSRGECVMDDEPCSLECVYGSCAERLYGKGYRKQEWISVNDRLPDSDGKYLVYTGHDLIHTMYYYATNAFGFEHWDVTHWMPLPEPPKGD